MAIKISAMTAAAALTGAEMFEVVQSGNTLRSTVSAVSTYVLAALPVATTSVAGKMSAADKTKLDGIAASANNYVLPAATTAVVGGVKKAAAVADLTDTSTAATTTDIATKVNALLASMRAAGLLN